MKKTLFLGAILASLSLPSMAEPLNVMPTSKEGTLVSIPLKWNAGVNLGYDSNVNPGSAYSGRRSSGYLNPYVGASLANYDTQTTYTFSGNLGLNYYFKEINGSRVMSNSQLGFDMTHNFDERLRFSTSNYVAFTQEPNYNYGVASVRDLGEYWYLYTDNSIGYRFGDSRWASVTGVTLGYFDYTDYSYEERSEYSIYQTARFAASERTVYTAQYRFNFQDRTYGYSTSSHYITGGTEYRVSPTAILYLNAGVQVKDNDGGNVGYKVYPTLNWAFSQQANDQFTYSFYGRWDNEAVSTYDPNTRGSWQSRPTVRFGLDTRYAISPKFTWVNGGDYVWSSLDKPSNPTLEDGSDSTFNIYTGIAWQLRQNVSLTARYNWTVTTGDEITTENYVRNRVSLGVQVVF